MFLYTYVLNVILLNNPNEEDRLKKANAKTTPA